MTKKELPFILAIDTSCDETSVAVTQGYTYKSNVIASQVQLHKNYGGVYPTVAKQAHHKNINPSISIALKRAGVKNSDIDAIAVTQGPGLAPALEIGIKKAKQLATDNHLPLIAINHIEGHVLSALIQPQKPINYQSVKFIKKIRFPVLGIVISGGHSEFIKINNFGNYEKIGQTIDDAAGECLDKVGRMLNLGYPAGSAIEKLAKKGNRNKYEFPLPMTKVHNFNLSYSGLKTAAKNKIKQLKQQKVTMDTQFISDFCASFQEIVFEHITYKLNKILKQQNFHEVWLGGGVAANIRLRNKIRFTLKKHDLKLKTAYKKTLCQDNAVMIGITSYHHYFKKNFVKNIKQLERIPRWSITDL